MHISEVKVHIYRQISGQKYEFPAFTGKITHVHTVCIRPFLLLLKGPGYEATSNPDTLALQKYSFSVQKFNNFASENMQGVKKANNFSRP